MGTKIKKIEIDAFRGYKEHTIFDFTKQNSVADLVVLHAPNGFGKTSFFESVEWCLSSKLMRIEKNKILQESEDKDRGFTLKNKNSIKEFGEVKITTVDEQMVYRQTGKSRDSKYGFKDYGYQGHVENQFITDNFDITSHLLTQDGMDSFLRFTNNKEKFDALTNFWNKGEETSEKYRQLEKLNTKIQKKILTLNNKIIEIRKEIENVQITQEEVDNINNRLNKINENLTDDKKIRFDFDKNTSTQKVVYFSSELKQLIVDIEQEVNFFKDKQNSLENLKTNFIKFKQIPREMENLNKTMENNSINIEKFKKLISLEKELNEITNKINVNKIVKEKVSKINSLYFKYQEIKKEIIQLNNSIMNLNGLTSEIIRNRQNVEKNRFEEENNLNLLVQNKEQKNKSIEKINFQLNKLVETNLKKIELKINSDIVQKEYETINESFQNLLTEKKQIEMDKLFSSMYINDEFVISGKYKINFDELKRLFLNKETLSKKINDLYKNKNKILELKNDITKLVSLGNDLIKNSETSVCPLCNHNYEQHDELLKRVLENSNDMFEVSQIENQLKIEKQNYETQEKYFIQKENNLRKVIDDELSKLNILYISINEDLKNKKMELDTSDNQILFYENSFNTSIQELKNIKTFDVNYTLIDVIKENYNTLVKDLLNEISILNQKENDNKEITKNLSEKINEANEKILEINKNIENNVLKRNVLETNPEFVEYNKLLQELNLLEENQEEQINNKLKDIKELLLLEEKKSIEINSSLITLKQELEKQEFNQTTLEIMNDNLKIKQTELQEFIEKINKLLVTYNLPIDLNEEQLLTNIDATIKTIESKYIFIKELSVLDEVAKSFITDLNIDEKEKEIDELKIQSGNERLFSDKVDIVKDKYKNFILQTISECFNTETINEIYNRIDPHPTQKKVNFIPELDDGTKLRVKTSDDNGQEDDPTLYNSSGQISILSLSIFLAKALQTKDELDTIFMDDPIQYLDSINVLSFIDLLRTIITKEKRQIVISTHDKNFYQLLQKKLDSQYYNSKFIELESYGKIKVS